MMKKSLQIESEVREIVNKILNLNADIDNRLDLRNVGMNSILFIQIIVGLEKTFNIEFEESQLDYRQYETLLSIQEMVQERLN
ncbi:acyl carrier protein [Bacillus pseudomycoides]|uniref:Phosphopantetheine-binding protein n=1 Tax=Bacillus pseudomycoides TaxID=64104 RepID=A0A2B6JJ95_9BACI|nr:acyl carrier protein [Bacillus pseudomycoides]PEA82326.1 phosphopantetheine-binding protein [Bacillus pseudomycoides]PED73206.1 phosphopantetheine-binding protein [Bacillus pseudomycoides]PEI43657.1 phosphopantetheine-binding protein [Bacillus pseudomycoides]PEI86967.1 phosphopantetheine-binding protein [Bacillus pseudomycoides]PEJ80750.1 phosphopantetheine-binding protein [Bacillus pseudomycoides]